MGNKERPLEVQLKNLGLNLASLPTGMKMLDVACGRDPILVGALRALGVNAEGLDPDAPNMPFYMRQAIAPGVPIPRADNSYDQVICHHHPFLSAEYSILGLTRFFAIYGSHGKLEAEQARATILESVRVVKPEGKIIIYPGLDELEKLADELDSLNVKRVLERVEGLRSEDAYISYGTSLESTASSFLFRTILTKSK